MRKSPFNPKAYLAATQSEREVNAANKAAEERETSSRSTERAGGKYRTDGAYAYSFTDMEKARMVADAVVRRGTDITAQYNDWVRIGYALAHSFGEGGRGIYHDVSSLYPEYRREQCDRQYDSCMRGGPAAGGVQLGTFFEIARRTAGVNVADVMREEREKLKASRKWDKLDSGTPCPKYKQNYKDMNNYTDNQGFMKIEDSNGTTVPVSHLSYFRDNAENGYIISARVDKTDLPHVLQGIYNMYDDNVSRDEMLLATLNVASGLLGSCNGTSDEPSGIYGLYKKKIVYAPLYNIIYASAGTGKGDVDACRQLIHPLQERMRNQYNKKREAYEQAMEEWEKSKKARKGESAASQPRPREPQFSSPIAAGNSSSASLYHTLQDNGGWALMFETEADTITQMQKTEYGQYSDLLRKAYHHEAVSMNRATDNLHIYIERPRLSVLLTCTPGQLQSFLGDFENGLASRFFFYALPSHEPKFDNVFSCGEKSLDEEFREMGNELTPLLDALSMRKGNPLQFVMTDSMQKDFLATFSDMLKDKIPMLDVDFTGFIYRLALGCFRYAMVLTALRLLERKENGKIELLNEQRTLLCIERDYETAKTITQVLLNHSIRVYSVLAKENSNPFAANGISLTAEEKKIYNQLPDHKFKTADLIEILGGEKFRRKANRMIKKFLNKYSILLPTRDYSFYIKAASLDKEKLAENADSDCGNSQDTNPKPLI